MQKKYTTQNESYKQLDKKTGNFTAVNSDSNINVTVYLSERDKYKTEFNLWSKKTAQTTLEMCRVVYEAKKELGSQDFLKLCNEIGRKGEDATVRKYLKIGEKYDKFYQYADLLPNSWTSIYEITQLPSDTFEALVATENSMANMTGDQIKELMGKKTEDKTKSSAVISAQPTTVASTTSAPPSVAPQTAQKSTEVFEDNIAVSSKTEESATAIASSDTKQTVSSEPSTQSISVAVDTTSDKSSSDVDSEFAQQAASTMLERVAATASTHVEIEIDEKFEPYAIAIQFNSKPSDIAVAELVESLLTIKSKYRLDFEFVQQNDFAM